MQLRKLLLVHSCRPVRMLTEQYLLSDFNDISITEAKSAEEALEQLERKKFDLILGGGRFSDMEGELFYEKVRALTQSLQSVILVTSNASRNYIQPFFDRGIEHHITIPFIKTELIDKVNEVSNPRTLRRYRRFYVPDTRITLLDQPQAVTARVINFSMGGVFCEMHCKQQPLDLLKEIRITLKFSEAYGHLTIPNISCRLSRLDVTGWDSDQLAKNLRITLMFERLSQPQREAMVKILASLHSY